MGLGLRLRLRLGLGLELGSPPRSPAVAHLLHLPYISPTSPLHLPYISPTSPPPHSPAGARQWPRCANARAAPPGRRTYGGDIGEMQGRCRGEVGEIWASLCQSSRAGSALTRPALTSPRASPRAGQSWSTTCAHQGRSRVRARGRVRGRGRAPNPNASPLGCMSPNPIPNPHRPSASDWKRRQRLSSVFAAAWSGLGLGLG